jgi:hypothetical protein
MPRYTFGKTVAIPFDRARERIIDELAQVGFGVLTEIDVQATMKKKLDSLRGRNRHPRWARFAVQARRGGRGGLDARASDATRPAPRSGPNPYCRGEIMSISCEFAESYWR